MPTRQKGMCRFSQANEGQWDTMQRTQVISVVVLLGLVAVAPGFAEDTYTQGVYSGLFVDSFVTNGAGWDLTDHPQSVFAADDFLCWEPEANVQNITWWGTPQWYQGKKWNKSQAEYWQPDYFDITFYADDGGKPGLPAPLSGAQYLEVPVGQDPVNPGSPFITWAPLDSTKVTYHWDWAEFDQDGDRYWISIVGGYEDERFNDKGEATEAKWSWWISDPDKEPAASSLPAHGNIDDAGWVALPANKYGTANLAFELNKGEITQPPVRTPELPAGALLLLGGVPLALRRRRRTSG